MWAPPAGARCTTLRSQTCSAPSGGWIPFAPVQWLGLAALGCLVYWFGWRAAAFVGAAVAYLLLVASGNPGFGWGLPARYPMIVIPLVAIPIALLIQHVRASRFLFVPLLAVSILFAFCRDEGLPRPLPARRQAADVRPAGQPPWRTRWARPHADLVRSQSGSGAPPDRPHTRPGTRRESGARRSGLPLLGAVLPSQRRHLPRDTSARNYRCRRQSPCGEDRGGRQPAAKDLRVESADRRRDPISRGQAAPSASRRRANTSSRPGCTTRGWGHSQQAR